VINSHLLYQLSYRGTKCFHLLQMLGISAKPLSEERHSIRLKKTVNIKVIILSFSAEALAQCYVLKLQ
jgi:hypothetical protein